MATTGASGAIHGVRLVNTVAIFLPLAPAFYGLPKNVDDIANHTIGKVLDCFGVDHALYERWGSGK